MPARVVDASVVAAWCFREPKAAEALALLRDSDLLAPLLLAYELTSIAKSKTAAYPDNADVFAEALLTALALPIHWSDIDHLGVLRLALDAGISTSDASYLYLARTRAVPLSTFDQKLAWAAQAGGL